MKKLIILLSVFNALLASESFAQKQSFEITIIQDSVTIPKGEHEIVLQKKPFKIQVALQGLEGVYLFAAFKDSIYKIDIQQEIPGFKEIPSMSMAEESFNPDHELIINNDGWAYWFYTKKENWHRFDTGIVIAGKKITGTKSLKQFYFIEGEQKLMVEEVSMPLYLFFFSAKQNKKFNLETEL